MAGGSKQIEQGDTTSHTTRVASQMFGKGIYHRNPVNVKKFWLSGIKHPFLRINIPETEQKACAIMWHW